MGRSKKTHQKQCSKNISCEAEGRSGPNCHLFVERRHQSEKSARPNWAWVSKIWPIRIRILSNHHPKLSKHVIHSSPKLFKSSLAQPQPKKMHSPPSTISPVDQHTHQRNASVSAQLPASSRPATAIMRSRPSKKPRPAPSQVPLALEQRSYSSWPAQA